MTSSFAIPMPTTHKVTLELELHPWTVLVDVGGIWSGAHKVGETFQIAERRGGVHDDSTMR